MPRGNEKLPLRFLDRVLEKADEAHRQRRAEQMMRRSGPMGYFEIEPFPTSRPHDRSEATFGQHRDGS